MNTANLLKPTTNNPGTDSGKSPVLVKACQGVPILNFAEMATKFQECLASCKATEGKEGSVLSGKNNEPGSEPVTQKNGGALSSKDNKPGLRLVTQGNGGTTPIKEGNKRGHAKEIGQSLID